MAETLILNITEVIEGNTPVPTLSSFMKDLPALIAMIIYMSLLAIVGLIGNILVIISVAISPRLRNTSYAFVVNLSVADLSVNVLIIPLTLVSQIFEGWPYDPFWCRCIFYLFLLSIGISLITLTAIAANRYCLVSYPWRSYQRFCNRRVVAVFFIALWGSSIVLVSLQELGLTKIRYDTGLRMCYADNTDFVTYWYVNGLTFYIVVVSIILNPLLYWLTFRTVRASKKRIQDAQNSSQPRVHSDANLRQRIVRPEEIRLTKIMVTIFVVMMVCWFPLLIIHFFKHHYMVPVTLERLSLLLVLTNSSINPCLYAGLNPHFRQAYKRILMCRKQNRVVVIDL